MLSIDYLERQNYVALSTIKAPDFIDVLGTTYIVSSATSTDSSGNVFISLISLNDGSITSLVNTTEVLLLFTKLTIGRKYTM